MYTVDFFGVMINDTIRMDAYEQALKQSITPGAVVVDIGTGTGIAALLACQLGATRVYAIEPNPAVETAREVARANSYAEQITIYQDLSTRVTLPEQADVIVSDLRGILPFLEHHIPSIIDARQRFLKPEGTLIPQQDTLFISGVDAPDLYERYTSPWCENSYGLDMRAGQKIVTNTWRKGRAKPDQILLEPQAWATLNYTTITQTDVKNTITWTVQQQTGTIHGYQVWFEAELLPGITFSTGPFTPELVYGTAFFPLSAPITVAEDDQVTVKIETKLVGGSYVWRWDTTAQRAGETIATYKQSTLLAESFSLDQMRKRADSYTPKLNEDGEVARFILGLMSQQVILGEIAAQLIERFPKRFSTWEVALSYVGKLSEKYT